MSQLLQADVRCPAPTCRALPGDPCVSRQGNPRQVSHKSRRNAESLASTSCPRCGARRGKQCAGVDGTPLQRIHQERRETAAPHVKTRQRATPPDAEWWLDKIHCGDVLDTLAAMPDECVDLVITSPPYNALQTTGGGWRHGLGKWGKASLLKTGYDSHDDRMDPSAYVAWQQDCLREMMRVVKPEGAILYNHRPRVQGDRYEDHGRGIVSVADEGGFALRQVILWDRGSGFNHNAGYFLPSYEEVFLLARPGRFRHRGLGRVQNVWRVKPDRQRGVPALPVDLVRIPLATLRPSYDAPPVVLDPFVGSGSVAAAAVLEDWRYVGIDISDEYCRQARNRVQVALRQDGSQGSHREARQASHDDGSQGSHREAWSASHDDGSQGSHREAWPASHGDGSQGWAEVPVRWDTLDKVVFDRIAAKQSQSKLQAVPLDQRALATELGSNARSLNAAIAKLKRAGALNIRYRRGPSLYSVSSEIPRWPVRVSGGIGNLPDGSPASHDGSPASHTRDPGPGLTSFSTVQKVNQEPGSGSRNAKGSPASQGSHGDGSHIEDSRLPTPASVWRAVLGQLQLEMPREHFNAFLQPCVGHAWEGADLVVAAASSFVVSWLELPLHLAMAQEALTRTLGREAGIQYRPLPAVAQTTAGAEPNATVAAINAASVSGTAPVPQRPVEDFGDPEICPIHPEPQWRQRSGWRTSKRIEDREGDQIYYCSGDDSTCSWTDSLRLGMLVDLGRKQLEGRDMVRIYYEAKTRRDELERGRRW